MKRQTKRGSQEPLTEAQTRELVDTMLRNAFNEHSRMMEKHLSDINQRLAALEK